ncbi:MAG: hypothetical protein ABI045_00555 [Flavobacteriales bacterium]
MSGQQLHLRHQQFYSSQNNLVGNNPIRQSTYGAAVELYNNYLVKLVNQKST